MPHDSHYIDGDGISWSIRDLLNSSRSRALRSLPVDYLWACWACNRRWGDKLPSPARLITHPFFLQTLFNKKTLRLSFDDTIESHTARILHFVRLYHDGEQLPPLVIGPDGKFWDGVHRLAALYMIGISQANVVDFSPIGIDNYDEYDTLDSVFEPDWIVERRITISTLFGEAKPYHHLFLPRVLRTETADAILSEYARLPWRLSETAFYEQYEITLLDCNSAVIGSALKGLRQTVLSYDFGRALSTITGISNLRVCDIACHRSTVGQQIGIHTDHSENQEACRLTLHFNPAWNVEDGGLFVTFSGKEIDSAVAAYPPEHNTAILFKISEHSYHAVTPVDGPRERYSMVIAMRAN